MINFLNFLKNKRMFFKITAARTNIYNIGIKKLLYLPD